MATSSNPMFTRSEKRRVRHKIRGKIKGAARRGLSRLFGIPLSQGLGGSAGSRRRRRAGSTPTNAPSSVRGDVIEALRGQGYSKATAEKLAPAAQPGDSFDSLFRRALARNPGELIIFGNPAKVYCRRPLIAAAVKSARVRNSIPAAVLEGMSIGLGLKLTDKILKNPLPAALIEGLGFGAGEFAATGALRATSRRRGRNAGRGLQFDFHGAYREKSKAETKERATPGAFIRNLRFGPGDYRWTVLTAANPSIVDQIKHGDRVTILVPAGIGRDGQEWTRRTGRAVMRSSTGGWVLNMGGAHGTPGLADDRNIVKVSKRRGNRDTMGEAIALGAPTAGRMSKRARRSALKRLHTSLFSDVSIAPQRPTQPTDREYLLRHAQRLRDLAARGMKPRAYLKEAEELERRAAAAGNPGRPLTVPEKHQLKIARDTLRMPDAMAGVMGGPTKAQAREIIRRLTGKNPKPPKVYKCVRCGARRCSGPKQVCDVCKTQGNPRRNGSLDRAEDLYQDFHHRPAAGTFDTQRSAKMRKDFTILGPLVAIGVNAPKYDQFKHGVRPWDKYKVEHWDRLPHLAFLTSGQVDQVKRILEDPQQYVRECPQLASSPNGRQLYAITPTGADIDLRAFDTDTSKDFVDLGEATFVVYVAKKPDEAVEWVHELGEDGGTRPRLMFDRLKRELFFIGGSYTVAAPGILH